MDTHLIQTSSLLQTVFFVPGESPYFFSKFDLLIWMPVKADNDHFFSSNQQILIESQPR